MKWVRYEEAEQEHILCKDKRSVSMIANASGGRCRSGTVRVRCVSRRYAGDSGAGGTSFVNDADILRGRRGCRSIRTVSLLYIVLCKNCRHQGEVSRTSTRT